MLRYKKLNYNFDNTDIHICQEEWFIPLVDHELVDSSAYLQSSSRGW